MMSLKGDGKPVSFIEDCAVPLEHLAEYTEALTEVFARHGTQGTWYAHASVGTLHVRPILDMRRDGGGAQDARHRRGSRRAGAQIQGRLQRRAWRRPVPRRMDRLAVRPGASTEAFARDQARARSDRICSTRARSSIRRAWTMRALFRFAPPSRRIPTGRIAARTALDWSAWNVQNDPLTGTDRARAAAATRPAASRRPSEMCNNNGHCRKFDAGTMCPSYRVTRDEQHLTRGRANTLRLALSGQLGPDALTGEAVREAMELCVSCKGCKRECPTGVDMARMKIEFLAHYKARHGYTLKDRLIAHLPDYAAPGEPLCRGSRTCASAARRSPPRRAAAGTLRQALPAALARRHLLAHRGAGDCSREALLAAAAAGAKAGGAVRGHLQRHLRARERLAAARVLQRRRLSRACTDRRDRHRRAPLLRTHLPRASAWSSEARDKARRADRCAARRSRRRGIAIVGLEPSCLLTLRDEALVMGLGEQARIVAAQAMLFEEFLAREARRGRFALALQARRPRPLLVHGHCHQKAFAAVEPDAARCCG